MIKMIIGKDKYKYEWIEDWIKIPETKSGKENGRTHGVVVTESGDVVIFHQADPAVLRYDSSGKLLDAWGSRFLGAHGMTLVKEKDTEYLWLTDESTGEVLKTTLDGKTILSIEKPRLKIYEEGKYSPTWVAVNEEGFGGNGDIWVTDGYGMSCVHRYAKDGVYLNSLNGSEGKAGKFDCPHSIFLDTRKENPEMYIADRGNKRFQIYDLAGNYKGTFGADFLGCPCGASTFNDLLIVPELCARLAVLNCKDELICYLGQNERVCEIPGWPNHERKLIEAGKFNSPHAAAVDKDGNIYVVEWIIGGRVTKLVKQ
jgi:hypothetical protein